MCTRSAAGLFLLLLVSPTAANAGTSRVLNYYQSLLAQGDNGIFPAPHKMVDVGDSEILDSTPEEIDALAPVVQRCLQSTNPSIRRQATALLYAITARPDSSQRIDPYIDDLIKMLDDPANAGDAMILSVLGRSYPRPPQRALNAILAHMDYKTNTAAQFGAIADSLLRAYPADASIVHAVLAGVANRPDYHLNAEMILELGNLRIINKEALAFIRAGFSDPSLRPSSIEAVGRMPEDVRETFVPELQSTLADPSADATTQSAASHVLMQK